MTTLTTDSLDTLLDRAQDSLLRLQVDLAQATPFNRPILQREMQQAISHHQKLLHLYREKYGINPL